MSQVVVAFIEVAFALVAGAIVGALLPHIVKSGGMKDRFMPCMVALTALSTVYFIFATVMLEGTAEMHRIGGPMAVTLLSFLLNTIAIMVALIVARIFLALAKFVASY